MICRNCRFSSQGVVLQVCALTGREHPADNPCDCEYVRVRREKEIKLKEAGSKVSSDLERLLNKISKPVVDPHHLMSILTDTSIDSANKITAAIEYLEDFV